MVMQSGWITEVLFLAEAYIIPHNFYFDLTFMPVLSSQINTV
jgi:hypothetical protein